MKHVKLTFNIKSKDTWDLGIISSTEAIIWNWWLLIFFRGWSLWELKPITEMRPVFSFLSAIWQGLFVWDLSFWPAKEESKPKNTSKFREIEIGLKDFRSLLWCSNAEDVSNFLTYAWNKWNWYFQQHKKEGQLDFRKNNFHRSDHLKLTAFFSEDGLCKS